MIDPELEGVVKYEVQHLSTPSEKFKGYKKLEALRRRLHALGLIGEKDGIGYGNISMRDREGGSFFITATQTGSHSNLSAKYYTEISSYDFDAFKVVSQGDYPPSSEALSHAMVYELAPEIGVVIHFHSLALWEFLIERDILFTTAQYGTAEMITEIDELYQTHDPLIDNAFVMRGHREGVMVFGRDLEEAELTLDGFIGAYLVFHYRH
ncbi:MAG: class II aldolase/adducin family protein [Campylobacterota bacterium]|nr:class II aldolase/adducin family protein [Campylobacterota bacterium]